MNKPLLINIVGPTASGKTATAVALAKHLKTEILSADSRQIYREMRIGTAVPSEEELATVPHHFIGFKSIFDRFTAYDFEQVALEKIRELSGKYPRLIMTGGTGLYFKAVTEGLDALPDVAPEVRTKLQEEWEAGGIDKLLEELKRKDPGFYAEADIRNPRRVLRALEIIRITGKPFSYFRSGRKKMRFFDTVWFGLTMDRKRLYDRINRRTDRMMASGLLKEAEKLHRHRHLPALQTVGYRELFEYFDGKTDLEKAVEEIKRNTRRYAKRQLTWFRKNKEIVWLDASLPTEKLIAEILSRLEGDRHQ